jgi:hypothetical protein
MSVEQMVRNLLERAVEDGLVDSADTQWDDPDPQSRTSQELTGIANMLARYLRDGAGAERETPDDEAAEEGRAEGQSDEAPTPAA